MRRLLVLFIALLGAFCVVADDKGGSAWIEELLGKELTNAKGEKISSAELNGKIIGLYFSAHWCPPCRQFTPKLVKFRDKLASDNKNFEIVFISSDRTADDMAGYMNDTNMKWLALPFGSPFKKKAASKYGITGIPTLIILGTDGKTITANGRGDVTRHPENAFNMWVETQKTKDNN